MLPHCAFQVQWKVKRLMTGSNKPSSTQQHPAAPSSPSGSTSTSSGGMWHEIADGVDNAQGHAVMQKK